MMEGFRTAMAKLAVLGQDASTLVDCSEVIPEPLPLDSPSASYPNDMSLNDIEQSCPAPFPDLTGPSMSFFTSDY